ncbi:MAG: BACON domain-containing protein [Proteiniphilum sp.]|nr:BACON domain-containing protein [Proteiniphilum sp.]
MKLKYIFPLFIAILTLMISCADEESVTLLDEIQVSSSYVAIPMKGGSTSITVTAKESWTAEKVTTDKNKVEWLTISTTTGNAGETELTFTAPEAVDGRAAEVLLHCGGKTQRINIGQGVVKATTAKAVEVNAGPDGKTFRVMGVCTSIVNTEYGNWYLTDETGVVYIYGTLDKKGGTKNFMSLGLEVGDEVTIEGPKSSYKGDPQMVNVTVIKINKSLVKVDSVENEVLPVEGGEFTAYLTCKGQGVSVEIPEDAKSWLSISSIQSAGTNAVVKFKAAANTGGDRGTTLTFRTTDGTKNYSNETTLTQKGAIVKATIAEFLAAEVGDTQYRLTGVITNIANTKYGNLDIRDFSGETYVYGIQDFKDKGLKVGDIITIVGKRAAHNDNPQVSSAVLESVIPVTAATIAEVLTKPDSSQNYYMVTGEITSVKDPVYGNLYLKEGDSEIYLYGCYPGYGATGDARKNLLATKGIKVGDTLTVIATKSSYSGAAQLANGIYFSHVSAE